MSRHRPLPTASQPPSQATPPDRPRDRTKLWALLTLTVLIGSTLVVLAFLVTGGQLPSFDRNPSWTPGADAVLDVQAPVAGTPAPLRSQDRPFLPGDSVRNTSGGAVNLRRTPGYLNKGGDDVIVVVPADQLGEVLNGPELVDGLPWWHVQIGDNVGWMAERSSRGIVLLALVE